MHFKYFVLAMPLCTCALLFSPASAEARGAYTVHPWEFHERRTSNHRHLETDYDALYEYYYESPQQSVTHGLHPFHRRRYYNPRPYTFLGDHGLFGGYTESEVYEYDEATGRWLRAGQVRDRPVPAQGSDCRNYSFNKPNYRVPPFGYRCEG